jgi:prevent-host-death family protein
MGGSLGASPRTVPTARSGAHLDRAVRIDLSGSVQGNAGGEKPAPVLSLCYDVVMSSSEPIPISVAEAKRRFADVLGTVRYQGERYVVERNGTPMAALVPLTDVPNLSEQTQPPGFLALVGAFEDEPEYAQSLADVVRSRRTQRSRPAPRLSG